MEKDNLSEVLIKLQQTIEQASSDAFETAGERGVELARQPTGLFKASENFNAAINFHSNGADLHGYVLADKFYSGWLEEGNAQSGPLIFPRNAKALRFKIGGEVIFAKYVRAHGPYKFMEKAGEKLETEFPMIFERCLKDVIE